MVDRSVVVRLVADNASFNSAMGQSANAVGNIGRTAEETSSRSVAAFGRIKTAAITLIGVGAAKSGQELNILKENAQIAFTTMLGGAEAARAKIAEIEAFSRTTVVGLDQWIKGGQLLTAYGLEAAKIVPILQNIADAAAASGQGVDVVPRIILALGQIQSKGRVMAQEMLQLTEAGIPAWQMLADVIGVDVKTAMAMAEKGMIDSKTALDALSTGIEQRFGGTAAKAVGTLGGSWSAFFTNLRYGAASALTPLTELQKSAASAGGTLATSFGGVVATILTPITAVLTPIAAGFANLPGPIMAGAAAMGILALVSGRVSAGFLALRARMAENMLYQRALAAQAGVTATRWNLAMSSMMMSAQRFGRGLLAAVGGPLGVVLIGATVLMSAWSNANSKAKEKAEANAVALKSLKDTLDQVNGSITAATRAKFSADWIADGTADKFKALGLNVDLAMQAATRGGPAMDAFKAQLVDSGIAAFEASDYWREFGAGMEASGLSSRDVYEQILRTSDAVEKGGGPLARQSALMQDVKNQAGPLGEAYRTVTTAQDNLKAGTDETRESMRLLVGQIASDAGVIGDDLFNALMAAKDGGTSVDAALAGMNLTTAQTAAIIEGLDDMVVKGGDNLHYFAGAAMAVPNALDAIADAADRAKEALKGAIAQAQALRTSIATAVTSFVDPAGAWDTAKTSVNDKRSARAGKSKKVALRDNPAVMAASDATKAGSKARDAAIKNAKATKDAAVKSAKDIQKSITDQGKADVKLAKDAQDAAQRRMDAAKKESDELQKLADQKKKAAEDSKSILEDAEFRARAARVGVEAAKLGLANSDASNRTQWEMAYKAAVRESEAATKDLEKAKRNDKTATEASEAATRNSTAATKEQERADLDLQTAKDTTAKISEESSERQQKAAEDYATAQEKAQERFTLAQEAAQARYDELLAQKELAETAARKSTEDMATGGSDAVAGMVKDIEPSLAQWKTMLQKQKKEQEQWVTDMSELSKKVPADVATYLLDLGPAGAAAVKELNAASSSELAEFIPLIRGAMPQWTEAMVQSLLAGIDGTNSALARIGTDGLNAMLAELNAGDKPIEEIFKKYGITAQQTVDQWGAIVWSFDVNTNYAEGKLQEFFTRQQNKYGPGPIGLAPNTYGFNSGGGYANGGWIRGGSGTKDDVAILGMGGEFVVKKSAAQQNKVLLEHLNGGGTAANMPTAQVTQAPSPMPQPAPSSSSSVVNFYYTISNPISEPTSVTTNRTLQYAAASGELGLG